MAAKKSKKGATGAAGFEFLTNYMKANPNAVYADAREAAAKAGHTIYPIVWGRAQALLGRVKSKPRGTAKKAAKAAKGAPKRRGRPPGSKNKPKAAGAAPTGKRRGRPPGSKNKVKTGRAGAARNGSLAIEIRDTADLARWTDVVNTLNGGGRASLHFDGSNWSLAVA